MESLWDENLEFARETIERDLPAPVRCVDPETLQSIFDAALSHSHRIFVGNYPFQGAGSLTVQIQSIVAGVVNEFNLPYYLSDEDLARLSLAGYALAGEYLAIRYLPKIKKTVAGVVRSKNLCTFSDIDAFVEDIASDVALKLVTKLGTYRFKQPLEHWVNAICTKTACSAGRKAVGRSKKGPRKYVSWTDLLAEAPLRPVKPEHRDVLDRIFEAHGKQGKRALKSNNAILLHYFWGCDAKEIAVRLGTTPGYVDKLISHDYPRLRKIGIDKFGVSGTDL